MKVSIGIFEIEIPETIDYIKKYNFVEVGSNHWKLNFTEVRRFGLFRYFIKSDMNESWSVCRFEDLEIAIKYYNRLK